MYSNRKLILIMTAICCLVSWKTAAAQNFAELKTNEALDTASTEASDKVVFTKPTSNEISNDRIENLMNKEEFQQFTAAKAYAERSSTYTLGPTDLIEISVLRHPEVSGQYLVSNEGTIQYEFVGDVPIAGVTKEKAAEIISKKLETYIVNPQVTIKIVGFNSKIVYVVGEVGRPGKIFMRGDTITIREALLEAGLPLLTAKNVEASMFTPSTSGKVERRKVNVDALLFKGDLRQNYVMKPGDTLYLPPTFWAKAMRVISPITEPVGQAASAGATVAGAGN